MSVIIKLLLLLINFTFLPSFAQLACNYTEVWRQRWFSGDNRRKWRWQRRFTGREKPLIHGSDGCTTSSNGAVDQGKFSHGRAAGGAVGGGRSAGESGGRSNSSPRIGGGAVIPVYAAGSGAAVKNRNHHSTASICSCRYQKDSLPVVVATTLLSLSLHNLFV